MANLMKVTAVVALLAGVGARGSLEDDDVTALLQSQVGIHSNDTFDKEGRPSADPWHPENLGGALMNLVMPNQCKHIETVDPFDMRTFMGKRWYTAWERSTWTRSVFPRVFNRVNNQNDYERMCKSMTIGGVEKTMLRKWDYFLHVRGRVGEGWYNKAVGLKNGISDYKSCLKSWGEGNGKFTVGNCEEVGEDPGADPWFVAAHEEYPGYAIITMGQPNDMKLASGLCTFADSRLGVFILTRDVNPRAFVLQQAADHAARLGLDTSDLVRVTYPPECGMVQHPWKPNDAGTKRSHAMDKRRDAREVIKAVRQVAPTAMEIIKAVGLSSK